jgi:hypothetical protein
VAAQVVYRYAGWVFGVEQGRPLETVEQLWRQMEATNVDEFKAAVAMQQMPMFTYVYSDHNGDLFWQSNSWTPDYSDLPLAYDWGVANGPPVPTETSSLKWESIVPWASQPQLTSPAAGGISHANEPPWYATVPMYAPDPSEYEEFPWIAPFPSEPDTGGSFGWRPRACLRYTLQAVADSRAAAALNASNYTRGVSPAGVSFDAFVAASMNVAMESAKHLLDSLLAAAIAAPSCTEVRPILPAFCHPDSGSATLWDYWAGSSRRCTCAGRSMPPSCRSPSRVGRPLCGRICGSPAVRTLAQRIPRGGGRLLGS